MTNALEPRHQDGESSTGTPRNGVVENRVRPGQLQRAARDGMAVPIRIISIRRDGPGFPN